MDDLISRQAVLDGLASIAKAKAKSDPQKSLMGRSMFFVEQMPSAEKTGQEPYDDVKYHEEHGEIIVDKAVWEDAKRALEQEPSGDAVSRQAVEDAIYDATRSMDLNYGQIMEYIDKIPSVKPQPKTGHWILSIEDWNKWTCSECGYSERTDIHVSLGYDYCPKCGARMESE